MRPFAMTLLLAMLAACQSTGDITYIPTATVIPGPAASVATVTVKDVRDEKPNRLATLRGLYGNPAKVFDTNKPVADEVTAIIISALQARGMMANDGPYRFQVTLRTFYGDTYFARRAFVDMDLIVTDRGGTTVYRDNFKGDKAGFELFSDITDLVPFTQMTLNTAIDHLLDKPELRQVLNRPVQAAS